MKREKFVVRGSGNVFRDLGQENADVKQAKALLAAAIIKALDRQGLSVRGAHDLTGIAAADFSRIRNETWASSVSIVWWRSPTGWTRVEMATRFVVQQARHEEFDFTLSERIKIYTLQACERFRRRFAG